MMDMETGKHQLVVSLAQLASYEPDDRMRGAHHLVNHLQFNPSGGRFLFLHRWTNQDGRGFWTRLYTVNPDGTDLKLIIDTAMVSHFDWRDDDMILAWTRSKEHGNRFTS